MQNVGQAPLPLVLGTGRIAVLGRVKLLDALGILPKHL